RRHGLLGTLISSLLVGLLLEFFTGNNGHFNPSVVRFSSSGAVVVYGLLLPIPLCGEPSTGDAFVHQIVGHCLGPSLGEAQIVFGGTIGIGVTLHHNDGFWIFLEYTGQFVQGDCGSSLDVGFIGIEIYPVLTTEGNVDALPYSFHLGSRQLFFNTFGLPVHSIADISSGSTSYHGADDGAQGS